MKLSTTILSATLLAGALALAGCGGSSNGGTDDEMEPMPTPEQQCKDDNGIFEDGECKTKEDLKKEGAEERDAEVAEEAREAMAKKLRDLLAVDAVMATSGEPTGTTSDHLGDALTAAGNADNGEGMKEKAHVMVYDNKGPMIKVDEPPVSFATGGIARNRHIMGTGFATGAAEKKSHKDASIVLGSYMGATGGYTCSGSECTSQRTKDGIHLGGNWTFTANLGQKYDADDARFAEWGWWIDEGIDDGDDANPNDKVGAWYDVTEDSDTDDAAVTAASGKATYKGQAVGKAAFHHSLSDSNVGGAFTADAELNADFDAGNGKLSGSITGFDVGGVKPDWSVELVGHDIASTGVATDVDTSRTKWTVDGTAGDAAGSWSAQFYDVPKDQHQPMGVAGGFEAQYESDGYMVGAFGAER